MLIAGEVLPLSDVRSSHVTGPDWQSLGLLFGIAAQGGLVVQIVEFDAGRGGGGEGEGVGGGGAEDERAACFDVVVGFPSKLRTEIVLTHVIIYLMIWPWETTQGHLPARPTFLSAPTASFTPNPYDPVLQIS